MNRRVSVAFVALSVILLLAALPTKAEDYSNVRIVRLSFVEGDVQYRHSGGAWQAASLNLPIQKGFELQTGKGYAEVEFEDGLAVRIAIHSSMEFTELALVDGHHVTRLTVSSGTVVVSAKLSHQDELSVAASGLNLNVRHSGRFRVDVSPTESWVTVSHGSVESVSTTGAMSLSNHQTLHLNAAEASSAQIIHSPAPDAFDKWVSRREDALMMAQIGAGDFLQKKFYTAGFADLYDFGNWFDIPGYGMGWRPYGMGSNWMPFVNGAWSLMPLTGWNWVSGEPWGWLPYHFGGWVDVAGLGWCWMPGDMGAWQPANASWVQVNGNQVGWMPSAPGNLPSRTLKGAPPGSRAVILAGQDSNGSITAAGVMVPLTPGAVARSAGAPQLANLPSVIPTSRSAQGMNIANGRPNAMLDSNSSGEPQKLSAPRLSGPVSQERSLDGPAALQAPRNSGSASSVARINSAPPSMQAPRSAPAPGGPHGGVPRGFDGGPSGGFNAGGGNSGGFGGGSSNGAAAGGGSTGGTRGSAGSGPAPNGGGSGGKGGGTSGGAISHQ